MRAVGVKPRPGAEVVTLPLAQLSGRRRLRKDSRWNCPRRKPVERKSSRSSATKPQFPGPWVTNCGRGCILGSIRLSTMSINSTNIIAVGGPGMGERHVRERHTRVLPAFGRRELVLAVIHDPGVVSTGELPCKSRIVLGKRMEIRSSAWLWSASWHCLWPGLHVQFLFLARRRLGRKFGGHLCRSHARAGTAMSRKMVVVRSRPTKRTSIIPLRVHW